MIKAIFTDMDDTLIGNLYIYDEAKAALRGYLKHFGVSSAEASEAFAAIDKENFKTLGYSRQRMPASFEATLKHFVPDADAEMVHIVRGFAEEIFTTVARIKGGTLEAMAELVKHYPVYIVTAGDKGVQENRVKHLPFKDSLSGVFVVDKKDKKTFSDILGQLNLKPEEVIMIGDSLKSDVISSVEAGMQAIWIEEFNSPFEAATEFPKERAYKFSSFLEATRHIVAYGTAAPVPKKPAQKKPTPPRLG